MASYLDTSCLRKLYVNEKYSDEAVQWATGYTGLLYVSDLSHIEMASSLYRHFPKDQARQIYSGYLDVVQSGAYRQIALDGQVLLLAQKLAEDYAKGFGLRSLDSIQLALALFYGIEEMATFDRRLGEAAQAAGLRLSLPLV